MTMALSQSINPEVSVPISAGQSNGVDIFNISGRSRRVLFDCVIVKLLCLPA